MKHFYCWAAFLSVACQCGFAQQNDMLPSAHEKHLLGEQDDKEFARLWKELHRCRTNVYVASDGKVSSSYLERRGYQFSDGGHQGFAIAQVDENFLGFRVVEVLVPTTWAIVGLRLDAPISQVVATIEKNKKMKLTQAFDPVRYSKKSNQYEFSVMRAADNPAHTIVQCVTNNQ